MTMTGSYPTAIIDPKSRGALSPGRLLAAQAFSRTAGAPLLTGNSVRLLKDGRENYPAWLDAIRLAKRTVYFENYIIRDDEVGQMFAEALIAKAGEQVRVRLIYDWLGGFGKTSRKYWDRLRAGGVEVRCYNRPRFDSPLGWLNRDHRKMLSVDGTVSFVTGLCVGKMWVGDPERGIDPWRDTGVEVRGQAVADIDRAFAQVWAMTGEPIPEEELPAGHEVASAGDMALRVVASVPNTAGMFRLDQLIAVLARQRLWLTDAYYAGTTPYVQGLRAAVKDGVDVRLLVPGASDIPILKPLSRSGYRALLEAGVRVFEWNGSMLHAKTAVADGRWARVGSTNLNIASWLGNCELDLVVEDERFAQAMEEMYLDDLKNATEVVLDARKKLRAPAAPKRRSAMTSGGGSAGRAAAGALRIGNAVGAAFTNHRVLEPVERRLTVTAGALLFAFALLCVFFPRLVVYPIAAVAFWLGISLLLRSYKLRREEKEKKKQATHHRPVL
jgi:cardiolipin synthase